MARTSKILTYKNDIYSKGDNDSIHTSKIQNKEMRDKKIKLSLNKCLF